MQVLTHVHLASLPCLYNDEWKMGAVKFMHHDQALLYSTGNALYQQSSFCDERGVTEEAVVCMVFCGPFTL
jgi:hypothetical protein